MRILHVCLDYPPRRTRYGSGTVTDDLLAALDGSGHEVAVLTPGRKERAARTEASGVRLIETPAELTHRYLLPPDRPTEMFAAASAVRAWNDTAAAWLTSRRPLGGWRPDVIHNDGWTTQPLANAVAAAADCPVVTTAHVIDRHYAAVSGRRTRPEEATYRRGEQQGFDASDLVVVPSTTARELAAHHFPEHVSKLRVVPHGLDWRHFDGLGSSAVPARSDGRVTVVYLGRLSSERGWRPFIDAFLAAAESDDNLRLRVIGDGARLTEAMRRYQHPSVSFLGALPRSRVTDELNGSDIYCNPALIETFGVAELEAMAVGLCVVSNTGFGKHTHVEHLVTGVTVPVARRAGLTALDQAAWTRRLIGLAADHPLRDRLGSAARVVARSRYRVDLMAANMLAVFQEAITKRAPRPETPNTQEASK